MAPIRRYLRITQHTVLEVRIYLDNPSHSSSWLLRPNDPALPRIIEAIRPLVLPKLREENERARGKKTKAKKGVRDVVEGDDFTTSLFLTTNSTRHTLLTAQKTFTEKPRIKSTSTKLTAWLHTNTKDTPLDLSGADETPVGIRREPDDGNETINLDDIPDAQPSLFVGDSQSPSPSVAAEEAGRDDKKKLGMNTAYDGFSIYGRILCLVVKRKGGKAAAKGGAGGGRAADSSSSQKMLENWVSTQAVVAEEEEDEDGDG